MRRKDRELNIFSMSALDLFASALGAFILITLILILRQGPQSEPVPQECPVPVPAPVCPVCPTPAPVPECPEPTVVEKPVIIDKFIMIEMLWGRKVDMDLHVKTPDGEYYFSKKQIPRAPGQFIKDDTKGGTPSRPAREVWISFEPTPGDYQICFRYFSGSGATNVRGRLLKPSGIYNIPAQRLTSSNPKQKKCPVRFKVTADYRVEIR